MQPGAAEYPEVSVVDWDAQTRIFVFGHVADRAMKAVDATSIVIGNQTGWMTTENGLMTITVARTDGTTLFFSGTASQTDIQALATEAFTHADDALEPIQTPATTPSASAGLGN
jgi:hypothetical protein